MLTLLSLSLTGVFLFSAATVLRSVNVNNMAASSMYDDCNYTIMWEASPEELLEISRENPLTPELREKVLAVDGVKSIIPALLPQLFCHCRMVFLMTLSYILSQGKKWRN